MNRQTRNFRGRIAGAALLLAVLTGCASTPRVVRTEVTSFDQWSQLPADKSYVFARTLEFQNSLELQSYENIVRDELATRGFKLGATPTDANLVVTLRPSVSGTAVNLRDRFADPFWGGPYGGFYPGRFGYGPFPGYAFGYGYGFGGYYDGFRDGRVEIFKRRLEVDIDSRSTPVTRFYEGRVESTGDNGSLPQAMPTLVRALFIDFPGNNGQTRRVDVPEVPTGPASR